MTWQAAKWSTNSCFCLCKSIVGFPEMRVAAHFVVSFQRLDWKPKSVWNYMHYSIIAHTCVFLILLSQSFLKWKEWPWVFILLKTKIINCIRIVNLFERFHSQFWYTYIEIYQEKLHGTHNENLPKNNKLPHPIYIFSFPWVDSPNQ